MTDGVYSVFDSRTVDGEIFCSLEPILPSAGYMAFCSHVEVVTNALSDGPTSTYCFTRLSLQERLFDMHTLLNSEAEKAAVKSLPKDFSQLTKVDGYVQLSTGMLATHLLEFIRGKVQADPIVLDADGHPTSLTQLFAQFGVPVSNLTLDNLNVKAENTFMRSDAFQSKHNPFGSSIVKSLFLEVFNPMDGAFFGELAHQVLSKRIAQSPNVLHEFRISLPGRSGSDWETLARWMETHKLLMDHVRWVVELPLPYSSFARAGWVSNFAEVIESIFNPLFADTNQSDSPVLFKFLAHISGFDLTHVKSDDAVPLFVSSPPAPPR